MKKGEKNIGMCPNVSSVISLDRLTEQQRKSVETDGRVLVSASAGSGKTTTMVTKIIRAVAEGVALGDILVLVYNEAAANELREKLHDRLFEAACLSGGEERERFTRSLDELAGANIGTIHAFCRALIKENFEKLGVSPAFDILNESEEARYMEEATDAVFADFFRRGDEVFMQLADVLSHGRKEDNLRAVVKRIYSVTEIQPDRKRFIQSVRESYADPEHGEYARVALASARAALRRVAKVLEGEMPSLDATGQVKYLVKAQAVVGLCREAERADFEGMCRLARDCDGVFGMSARMSEGGDRDAVESVKQAIKAAAGVFGEWKGVFSDTEKVRLMHAQNAAFADKLLEITQRLDDEFSSLKRADDVMTYSDLEFFAAELVGKCDFKGRFKAVFVDEYQDVNPVQEYIIDALLPDNAYMVGDVKQCIYAFRLADPGIFLARKRRYDADAAQGCAIEFNTNFRSVSAVLGFVNELFDVIMTEESSDVDYAGSGRFAVQDDKKDKEGNALAGGAEVHYFPYSGRSSRDGVYAEAKFIADTVKSLVGKAKGEDGKVIGYGDCVVLIRSRSLAMQRLAQYIAAEGVPLDAGIFAEESSAPEDALVNFLTVLDNPRNDVPLAGFMLSYFGGFDESELAEVASLRGDGEDFYDAVLAAAAQDSPLGAKVARMLEMLDAYRLKASFKSVPELMQSIVSDFNYDAYVEACGEGAAEKVIAFVTARADKDSSAGLGKFLAAYAAGKSEKRDRRPAGGDRVRVATYHSYKGLEAPVVFAAGAGTPCGAGKSDGDVVTDNRGYIGLNYFDFGKRSKSNTLTMYAVRKMKEERERREEMRLYYVLLTRAKQYLYVTGAYSRSKSEAFGRRPLVDAPNCLLDYISEVKYENGMKTPCIGHGLSSVAPEAETAVQFAPIGAARPEDEAAIRSAVGFRYPYFAETGLAMKYSVSALDGGGDELTLGAFADRADEGILYHKIMENIDFNAVGKDAVVRELDRMTSEGVLTREERGQADAEAVARCLDSDVIRMARRSRCYREKSFLMYVPAREVGRGESHDKVLVQGIIDLLIDGEERIIVDFKNSLLKNAEALEKYKNQLKLYKKAVESSFLGKVDKILLYSFKTGKTVDVEKDI